MAKFVCALLISFLSMGLFSNELGEPFIVNYTPDDMGGSAQNWCAVQDHRGVMYIGNTGGLLEFDGSNWRMFLTLTNSIIRSVTVDQHGTVYAGGSGDFGYLASTADGELRYISLKEKIPEEHRQFNDIYHTFVTTEGIYFMSNLKIFRWAEGKIEVIPNSMAGGNAHFVYNRIIVRKGNKGLYIFEKDRFNLLPQTEQISMAVGQVKLLPYPGGKILIITEVSGLFLYHFDRIKSKDPSLITPIPSEAREYLKGNRFYTAASVSGDRYACATVSGGVIILDKNGGIERIINKNRGLIDNLVYSLYEDRMGGLWVLCSYGASRVDINSPLSVFTKNSGLNGQLLTTIRYRDQIFAGTVSNIFSLPPYKPQINNDSHQFKNLGGAKSGCFDMILFKDVLIGSGDGGDVIQIKPNSTRTIFRTGTTKVIAFAKSKRFPDWVFLGTYPGLVAIQLEQAEPVGSEIPNVKVIKHVKFPEVKDTSTRSMGDQEGNIWMTTHFNGIIYIRFNSDDIQDYEMMHFTTKNGLPHNSNNYLLAPENKIYFGTRQGLYRMIWPKEKSSLAGKVRFEPDTESNQTLGLPKFQIDQMLMDSKGQYWINLGGAIGFLDKEIEAENKFNTLPLRKIPRRSWKRFYIDPYDIVWVCGPQGLYRYDPRTKGDHKREFNTLVRFVIQGESNSLFKGNYFNEEHPNGEFFPRLSLSQPTSLIPQLPFEQNSLTFYYTAVQFDDKKELTYAYYLEGFDKKWSQWKFETRKGYTNLPGGNYTFRVVAKNLYDTRSREGVFQFSIALPWYQTWWAYTMYVISFFFILFMGIRLNSRRLTAANIKLEKIIKERTQKIEEQKDQLEDINQELKDFAYIVSHDLKAPLRGISQIADWLKDDYFELYNEEGKDNFNLMVSRVGRMQDLIDGILKYSRAGTANHNPEDINLDKFVPELISALAPPEHIKITKETELPTIHADKVRISQLFQNMVSNAIKYNDKPEGIIRIGCKDKETHWEFYVADNGPGIDEKYQEKIFQIFQTIDAKDERESTGVGLSVVKKILALYNGTIRVTSKLGEGATFYFTIKK